MLASCGMAVVDVWVVFLVSAACEIVLAKCIGVLFGVRCICSGSGCVYYFHKSGLADLEYIQEE